MAVAVAVFKGDEITGDNKEGRGDDDDDDDEERGEGEIGVRGGWWWGEVEKAPLGAVYAAKTEGAVSACSVWRPCLWGAHGGL